MRQPGESLFASERLATLRRAALLDTPAEERFDRLTRFAARLLQAPVALISLVDEDRQFFKSQCGLPEPWASERQTPLSHSFCQHVVASAEPLVIENARQYALVKDNLAIPDLGVEAYLGVPIRSSDGHVLGSFCVIDHEPRRWTAEELEVLHEVATSAMTEIELRTARVELEQRVEERTEDARYWEHYFRALVDASPNAVFAKDSEGRFTLVNPQMAALYDARPEDLIGKTDSDLNLSEEQVKRFQEADLRVLTTGESVHISAQPLTRDDGEEPRWFETRKVALATPGGGREVLGVATEVTELKEAEAALRERERRFRALVENVSDAVTVVDRDGVVQYVSPAFERITGYSAEDRSGRSAFERVHPEDLEAVRAEFRRIAAEPGARAEVQPRLHHKDGRWRTVKLIGENLLDDPAVGGIVVTYSDVTERLEAEEALRESARHLIREQVAREHAEAAQERITHILESITDGFFAVDDHWCFTYVNREVERLSGIARAQLLGRNIWEALSIPEESRFRAEYHRAVREQVPVEFEEHDPLRGVWLRARAYPYAEGLTVFVRDLTEHKNAEAAVQRSERLLAEAQRIARLGSWEWNTVTGEISWSDEVYRIWGYDRAEPSLTYEALLDGIHPEDRALAEARVNEALASGTDYEAEYRVLRPDGGVRHVHVRGRFVSDEAGQSVRMVGAVQDVTERKQVEIALRAANEEAEAASRAKSEMLSRTSHELRTPLNAILGFAQVLEMEVEREEDREGVEQILRAGRRLVGLVDDVLDIARAESGHLMLDPGLVDVGEIVGETLSLLRPLADRSGVDLPRIPPVRAEAQVLADPGRLKQVLTNLLSNAIQYNRAGGRVEVVYEDVEPNRLRIQVRDTGPGIPAEKLPRLFTPFDRLDAEKDGVPGRTGVGLGLARSKALVEAMGGTLGVESVEGEGSRFWVELPRPGRRTPGARDGGRPTDAAAAEPWTTPVVLYVEDEPPNVRIVERILRRSRPDVELITAAEGRQGLELAREHRPDLILLDLNLPGMSGEEVLRALQDEERTREIPVVMISGDALPAQIEQLREAGAVEYLTKPFDVFHFLEVLDESLGTAEP